MKNFNRGGGYSDRKGGGRDFGRGGSSFSKPAMHQATCAECGQSCEVPFKPTGDRPVYCSNCFKGKDATNSNRPSGRDFVKPNFRDNNDSSKDQRDALNAKLDKILQVLEKISSTLQNPGKETTEEIDSETKNYKKIVTPKTVVKKIKKNK